MKNIWIVIAAFNEEKSIGRVIDNLKKHDYKNIVVTDDGSNDSTFEIAKKHGAYALKHCINRGQGASLQTGIDFALRKGADVVITFDADGQHLASEIKDLLKPIEAGYDIALGSRFLHRKTNVPLFRKFILKGGAFICWVLYGIKLTDTHNGFRALSRRAAKKIRISADRMEHASQIIEKTAKYRLKYKEVPVTIRYSSYSKKKGQTSLNAIKIFIKMVLNRFFK